MELTLLEVNLAEPSFNAKAPFSGDRFDENSDAGTDVAVSSEADETGGGRSPLPFLVGLVFLVGIGLAVRRLRSDSSSSVEEAETEPIAA